MACGKNWSQPKTPMPAYFPKGVSCRIPPEKLIKSLALLVSGVPMNTIERLMKIKAETLKAKFVLLLTSSIAWAHLEGILAHVYKIPKEELAEFQGTIIVGLELDRHPAFRCWGQQIRRRGPRHRYAAQRRAEKILNLNLGLAPCSP